MSKKRFSIVGLILFVFVGNVYSQSKQTEELVLTTYYPVPYGDYHELRVRRVAIGENYYNSTFACWDNPSQCAHLINPANRDVDLIVEGNVGVGTVSPEAKLDVAQNNAIRVGHAYVSSGGNYANVATNVWYDGSAWRTNGIPGTLIQEYDQNIALYRHDGSGNFSWTALFHGDGNTYISGGLKNEEGRPAFFMSVAYDDCGWWHPYVGCPAGYYAAGTVHTGPGRCDGWVEGQGYDNGTIDSGWMALCVAQ